MGLNIVVIFALFSNMKIKKDIGDNSILDIRSNNKIMSG